MRFLQPTLTELETSIKTMENYLEDEGSFNDTKLLSDVENTLYNDINTLQTMCTHVADLKSKLKEKYETDKFKYKNSVLYSKRKGIIKVDREQEKIYYKDNNTDKYKRKQHTYYNFALEVATEHGIIIHRDRKQYVWKDKTTKDASIKTLKELMNREYFVDPTNIEVIEA